MGRRQRKPGKIRQVFNFLRPKNQIKITLNKEDAVTLEKLRKRLKEKE